jgi:uncharacterized protein YacL
MKISGWEGRILVIISLGLLGTFAFNGFSPWYGLAGVGIGLVAVAAQILFVKLPADEIIYVTTGVVIGLVSGALIMLILKLAHLDLSTEKGVDPLVMIPFATAYVFAHVFLLKGKKLGLLASRVSRSDKPAGMLLDLTAVIDGRVADLAIAGLVRGPFILPASVKTRLEELTSSSDLIARGRGRRGVETLERLEEIAGKSGGAGLEYRDFGKPERERFRVLESLRREEVSLLSSDQELVDIAMKEGNHVINLAEIGPAARPVTLPGETLSVKLVRKGRNPRQAVGFLDDGTMIVVEEAEGEIGKVIDVEAHTTFRSSGGTMVFARLTGNGSAGE